MEQDQIDKRMLAQARAAASLSPDPSTKVGAVLLTEGGALYAGYNHPCIPGLTETGLSGLSREARMELMVHAEEMVLTQAGRREAEGGTMYLHAPGPCLACARIVAHCRPRRFVCIRPQSPEDQARAERWQVPRALEIIEAAGVRVHRI